MKKLIAYGIPVIVLGIFILIMTAGQFLKRPWTQEEDVVRYIDMITNDVKVENWKLAEEDCKKLTKAWIKVVPRIQFSVERDEIYSININLSRLDGVITGQDKAEALAELGDIIENWKELGK
jgi:Domain of unknown function (DUF4363)